MFNWYDTFTLRPLQPGYISTVDSGNLVGNLITLQQGLRDYLSSPLIDIHFAEGIRDTLSCAGKEGMEIYERCLPLQSLQTDRPMSLAGWSQVLDDLAQGSRFDSIKEPIWKDKCERMIMSFRHDLSEYMPGIRMLANKPAIMPEKVNGQVAAMLSDLTGLIVRNVALKSLPGTYSDAVENIDLLAGSMQAGAKEEWEEHLGWLLSLKEALVKAGDALELLIDKCDKLIGRMDALSVATEFLPLYDKKKHIFSIGYNMEEKALSNSFYDLFASEARLTSYIGIARAEIPLEHWFRMGRALTVVDRYKGLISWTGTMFEYLMPLLLMKSCSNTLLDETYSFVIKSQIKYGRQKGMPWGASESGFNAFDINNDYQYKAIGVPWLGLKRGLMEDAVTAPYATMLALLVDPQAAIRNIANLESEGLEGPFGFYESADYTPERLPFETKRAVIKSFMAHHQGMSLVALNNYLHRNAMQKRFHADPEMNAARLLLEEKVPTNIVFTKETREKIMNFKGQIIKAKAPIRRFMQPDPVLPKAHILSNGNYSIMITGQGNRIQ